MLRRSLSLLSVFVIVSCGKERTADMLVVGNVKGLKKGTLYLKRMQDSTLINVDSIVIDGDSNFTLGSDLESPEVFYLHLDKKDGNAVNDHLLFFGEKGTITVNSKVDAFDTEAEVVGSENHTKFEEYRSIIRQFNDEKLGLIKEQFELTKTNDTSGLRKNIEKQEYLLKRRYRYSAQFVNLNKALEVAPYVLLADMPQGNPKLLDSLYNMFPENIKNSTYGKGASEFIKELKEVIE